MQVESKVASRTHPFPQLGEHAVARGVLGAGLVSSAHFANDAVTSMVPALLPLLATRFTLAPAELALLVGSFAVSTALPQPYFGALADRFGAYRVGAAGLAVSALATFAMSLVSTVHGLWLALLVGGLGSSALHPAGIGLARTAAASRPGLAVALFSAAGMAGVAAGPLLALWLSSGWGLEGLGGAAVPALLVAALFYRFAPRPMSASRGDRPSSNAAPRSLTRRLTTVPLLRIALVALSTNLVLLTFANAVPLWLVDGGVAESSPLIGWTLATFSMASALGGIVGGLLGRSPRRATVVALSLALALPALQAVLTLEPGSVGYFAAVAAGGALLYVQAPLVMVRAQELTPGSESAVAGVLLGGTSAVAGVVYAGLGALQSALGIGSTLSAVFLLVLPAAYLSARALGASDAPTPAVETNPLLLAHCLPSCAPVRCDTSVACELQCARECHDHSELPTLA